MNKYYTNISILGDSVLHRGVENGKPFFTKVPFKPVIFLPSTKISKYKTLNGENIEPLFPGTIKETKEFLRQYRNIDSFKFYGNTRYEYQYINTTYPNDLDWDITDLNIVYIDIECEHESGFPDIESANEAITLITIKTRGVYHTFGCQDFHRDGYLYHKCEDEAELLQEFIKLWVRDYPDIITGWNVQFFDMIYIVNRINVVLSKKEAKKLSPWGVIKERTVNIRGQEQQACDIYGIATMDYLDLYKRYTYTNRENYKLGYIASVELGTTKIDYSEYGSLHLLYENNWEKYVDYNIHDVDLVTQLDDKLKLIELALSIAYDAKINFEDTKSQVRIWDTLIYNHLAKKNIMIPQTGHDNKDTQYAGAYVMDPITGFHKWVVSFDVTSLYPSLILALNLSPETLIDWPTGKPDINNCDLKLNHLIYSANDQYFRNDIDGFLPEMIKKRFDLRVEYKNEMMKAKHELQNLQKVGDVSKEVEKEYKNKIAKFDTKQKVIKILLNSCYGSIGNPYFRFYDIRNAEAITLTGQLAIKHIAKILDEYLNDLFKTVDEHYVIYGDTDSVYVTLDALVKQVYGDNVPNAEKVCSFLDKVSKQKLEPLIASGFKYLEDTYNYIPEQLKMKREVIADKAIWVAKKRYIVRVLDDEGMRLTKPKIKAMGLELKKSSTPSYCRDILTKSVDKVFNSNETDIINFIKDCRVEFESKPFEEIAFPRGTNDINKWKCTSEIAKKGCPIHIRGVLYHNALLKHFKLKKKYKPISDGDKIKYIYLKKQNPIGTHVIAFLDTLPKEFELENYIDYDLQFNKSFVEPLKIILNAIGWKTEKENTLESFFT